ncbi:hypothetical protein [Breznakiella homolactica]|uniref:Uncharacterized protein n=1 Tax=Breznakiella homolactica TaxID=2798577 RepID=A0A7T7XJS8_9SPIR|nr:hypothetical protein [Breznakiella homolactica]QQO07666.1 hypothetical protein JFL75_11990 [Breznakiella homolactica]
MNIEYFTKYCEYESNGLRKGAKEQLRKFIESFDNFDEKESWTIEYLPSLKINMNSRIRNEIFEEIVFPVLLKGYNEKNITLMIWLVKLSQNLYQNQKIWEKIDYKTDMQIIRECWEIDPRNAEIQDIYLDLEIRGIAYSIHEWPSGILIGNDGATLEESKALLKEVPFLKSLDRNNKFKNVIADYEDKLKQNIQRLEK